MSASACGEKDHLLYLDCRSLESEPVPLPAGIGLCAGYRRAGGNDGGDQQSEGADADLDGAWYDNELAGSTERLSFGTVGGVTTTEVFDAAQGLRQHALHGA